MIQRQIMSINKVYDKETGELLTDIKYDSNADLFKKIEYEKMNTIFNFTDNGKVEVMYYKKPFNVPKHIALDEEMISDTFTENETHNILVSQKRSYLRDKIGVFEDEITILRNFKNDCGVAVPVKPDVTIQDLLSSIFRGGKRAKQNFYNYALSNDWEYFCTYTFKDEKARYDLKVLQDTWQKFIQIIRYKFPDVKVIAVPEKFEKGGFHLHALMAKCDLKLTPCRDFKTKQFLFTDYGHPRMISCDWKNGFCEVVMINPESSQLQVVNYLTKYFTKSFDMPYGSKRYYMTTNLDCRTKYIDNLNELELDIKLQTMGLIQYKDNDSFTIYRNY